MSVSRSICVTAVLLGLASSAQAAAPVRVSFNAHIRPLFARHCISCHGGVRQLSGLSFVYREQALAEAESGMRAIVPGEPEESYLLERVADPDPEFRMPPAEHGPALSADEIALLRQWIAEGAAWEEHWAFTPPREHDPPPVAHDAWPRDVLDRFILARIEAASLAPAPAADRAAWLRRATLDLTGVPPTPDEYDAFALDNGADAHERVVDRLLASPRFGERWAAMWLDLARYADTQGYEKDDNRTIWPYRDWVLRAFNADLPYDEFIVKQLAGDLLPEATLADRIATAFHRNTQTNTEGGTDDEEFRTAAVLDRVATTWEAFLGTTFRCAQCHDHPYEPIRNAEYYQFVALWNTTRDSDVSEDFPLLAVPTNPTDWLAAEHVERRIGEYRAELFERSRELRDAADDWKSLPADVAKGSGAMKLEVREVPDAPPAQRHEILATGTIPANASYTLEFPLDRLGKQLTALRIIAWPEDVEAAKRIPELGFVLTRLSAEIVSRAAARPRQVHFDLVLIDEPEPPFDPQQSLLAPRGGGGWAQYTRMSFPRLAIFVVQAPVRLQAGDRLRLVLEFNRTAVGDIPLVIRRASIAATADPRFTDFVANEDIRLLRMELEEAINQQGKMPHVDMPVIAEEFHRFKRPTHIFVRGNWLDKGDEVMPGTPHIFPPLPRSDPDTASPNRLAAARWIASPDHPLTARVMVNRLWQELFGTGLVETAEDFGTSGAPPSHPELLDHLSLRFAHEHRWSVKQLLRDIVLSATYRQSSDITPDKLAADPRNRLLARGPRTRLAAEMVRDQALALSGRLSPKMFGPPVMPPQPEGVWRSVYNGAEWRTADGDDRFRRAVYTFWKRTSGYPSMLTFDAPSRDVCVGRRIATNTPLQALATMNDEAYIELAAGLAERMAGAGQGADGQIAAAYRWATGQEIAEAKRVRLRQLYDEAAAAFDADPDAAKDLADTRERYALTIVANAILNLDEVLTK